MHINFTPLIIIEIIFTIAVSISLNYCDKKVLQFYKRLEDDDKDIIDSIKSINKELVKLNYILEKIENIRKIDWAKLIIKTLDVINIILILAPLGKKNSLVKKLFSIKSLKSIIGLVR